jgi:transcriptional regulator with XRE-family HTH domain
MTNSVQSRVKRLRLALGLSQRKMAEYLGVNENRWNNIERGFSLGIDLARIVCRKCPGVTLDWLYEGNPYFLSPDMRHRLGEGPPPPKS